MGIPMSLFQKLGFNVQSLTADKVFDKYFPSSEIQDFPAFHIKFLQLCNDFNSIMLGKHYQPPSKNQIEACFNAWLQLKKKGDEKRDERKQLVLALLSKNVKEIKTDDAIFMTGLVAPPAAMVLKKSSENVPQLKKFRLNLIPDIFFVPSCTVIALFTVKLLQLKTGSKTQ